MSKDSALGVAEKRYPRAGYAWFVVICLQLAYMFALVDRQILALLVQPVRADLAISDTQFSLLVGIAFALFYGAMGLVFGRLADTLNRRNMIVVGMTLWCMATVVCGLAQTFNQLFLARILVGVGEAALSPAAYSMIADYFPKEKRARAAAAYAMAISLGAGVSLLFGGTAIAAVAGAHTVAIPLVGEVRSWQAVFFLVGLPGLIVPLTMLFIREPVRQEISQQKSTLGDAVDFIRRKAGLLGLIIPAFALNGLVTYCMASWTPAMFIRNFGWSATEIATAQGTILILVGTLGMYMGGWVVSRKGVAISNAVVLSAARNALLVMPVFAIIAGIAPEPWMRLVGVAGLAFFGGFPSALAAVAIYHCTPNQFRGQVTSIYLMTGTVLGLGIGVTLVASFTDFVFRDDQAVGKSLALVVACAAALSALLLHRAVRRPDKDLVTD